MKTRIQQILCLIRCESGDALRAATELVERLNHPNSELARTIVTVPGGREEKVFRVGDYFDGIERQDEVDDPLSFFLTFLIKADVDAYWKTVLVTAIEALRGVARGVTVSIVPGGEKT